MSVKELIEALQRMNPDAEVVTVAYRGLTSIVSVRPYIFQDVVFGNTDMVILQNGTYPLNLKDE